MRYLTNNLTRWHAVLLAGLLLVFTLLTFLITDTGLDQGPEHQARVLWATASTITGPLTGAVSREFQDCCLRCSLSIMVFCGPVLLTSVLLQFVRWPGRRLAQVVSLGSWTLGWLTWFLGGIASFAHALS